MDYLALCIPLICSYAIRTHLTYVIIPRMRAVTWSVVRVNNYLSDWKLSLNP